MKMVKSLLLVSLPLVAVTAWQAAYLPVKSKPVEFMKIFILYGQDSTICPHRSVH